MRLTWCSTLVIFGLAAFVPTSMGYEWQPGTTVFEYRMPARDGAERKHGVTIIGKPGIYVAQSKDTLLDIARLHHLGYHEIVHANPEVDPWLPGAGSLIAIPAQWILPGGPREGLVLNIAEMRLYHYLPNSRVMTFPLGVSVDGQETPAGKYRIGQKRTDPVWYVPISIQQEMEYPREVVPPGPNNPLGEYWMRLSTTTYGIHGTNNPWAIGRRVTHGCIRLYPEDIAYLYPRVPEGTPVRIIYQHAKVGFRKGEIYFQIYRGGTTSDGDLMADLIQQIMELKLAVNLRKVRELLPKLPDGAMTPLPPKETKSAISNTTTRSSS